MDNRELPQITWAGSLIAFSIFFFCVAGLSPVSLLKDVNLGELLSAGLLGTIALATFISQITISIWSVMKGFMAIDYQKDFWTFGNERIVQFVFDKYMHGCDENGNQYVCDSVRKYSQRRVGVYWLNLVAIFTSLLILIIGTLAFIFLSPNSVLAVFSFYFFYLTVILICSAHKKRVADELYKMEKNHLCKYREHIINDIKSYDPEKCLKKTRVMKENANSDYSFKTGKGIFK